MIRHGASLWARHPHVRSGEQLTFGERAADRLRQRFGSWSFLGILNGIFFVEVGVHIATGGRFDQGLLFMNLFLSWLAAQQGGALQIAANRGDRISSEMALHTYENGQKILELNQTQLGMLETQTAMLREMSGIHEALDRISPDEPPVPPGP